jgi:hypothetical protein
MTHATKFKVQFFHMVKCEWVTLAEYEMAPKRLAYHVKRASALSKNGKAYRVILNDQMEWFD